MFRFTTMMIAVLVLGFQSAHAAPPQDVPSIVVRFADLDLTRTEGAESLYRRLATAAKQICAPFDDRYLARHMLFEACVTKAIGTAVAKVDRPALTAYYENKVNGRNTTIQVAQR